MKRRTFITLLGGTVAWPLAANAQQTGKVVRLGFLGASLNAPATAGLFQQFLASYGTVALARAKILLSNIDGWMIRAALSSPRRNSCARRSI